MPNRLHPTLTTTRKEDGWQMGFASFVGALMGRESHATLTGDCSTETEAKEGAEDSMSFGEEQDGSLSEEKEDKLAIQWNEFKPAHIDTVTLMKEPTQLFLDSIKKEGIYAGAENSAAILQPFTDASELFNSCRELARIAHIHINTLLKPETGKPTGIIPAWEILFEHVLSSNNDIFKDSETQSDLGETPTETTDQSRQGVSVTTRSAKIKVAQQTALRLGMTSPQIFGHDCILARNGKCEITLNDFEVSHSSSRSQRYDMVMWVAAFNVLGNGWESPIPMTIPLESHLDLQENVLTITVGQDTFHVTRQAKAQMRSAIVWNGTPPTLYYRQRFAVDSVCSILKQDISELSFPQTPAELDEIDWDAVDPINPSTYPKGKEPTPSEFKLVKEVYEVAKDEEDKLARDLHGHPKSGVQSYQSFLARWRQWRNNMAIFRAAHPQERLSVLLSKVQAELKFCKSETAMSQKIADMIKQHKKALKRAEALERAIKKTAEEEKQRKEAVQAAAQETKKAEEAAKAAEAVAAAAQEATNAPGKHEKEAIAEAVSKDAEDEEALATVGQEDDPAQVAVMAAQCLQAEKEKVANARQRQRAASKALEKKQHEKRKLEEQKETNPENPTKMARRLNTELLSEADTPRQFAEKQGQDWNPPRMDSKTMKRPGKAWRVQSVKKLDRLKVLHMLLKNRDVLPAMMSFSAAMEALGADFMDWDFEQKVFLYLALLILNQRSGFDTAIDIMVSFRDEEKTSPKQFSSTSERALASKIKQYNGHESAAAKIRSVAEAVVKNRNLVPKTKDGLQSIGCDETTASLLMSHVFGSTELPVGLHARKILTALDMIDWEQSGAEVKVRVKMVSLPAAYVRKSIKTWLPAGETRDFHDLMESLGGLLGNMKIGDWGKVKASLSSLSPGEKKATQDMVETISQFYKAIRKGRYSS